MHDDTVVASGHASATPPMSVMNSRRLTASPSLLETAPYHTVEWGSILHHSKFASLNGRLSGLPPKADPPISRLMVVGS